MPKQIILENILQRENPEAGLARRLYRGGTPDKDLCCGLQLPKLHLREEDIPRYLKALGKRISTNGSRYPLLKITKGSLTRVEPPTYHLRFSRYSDIENLMVTTEGGNTLWVDYRGPKERVIGNKDWLDQQTVHIYEAAKEILIKRTYLESKRR